MFIFKRLNKMAKWADYAICAVKYNDEKTHIIEVERFEDEGEKLDNKKRDLVRRLLTQ